MHWLSDYDAHEKEKSEERNREESFFAFLVFPVKGDVTVCVKTLVVPPAELTRVEQREARIPLRG